MSAERNGAGSGTRRYVSIGLMAVAFGAMLSLTGSTRARRGATPPDDDCDLSECGPDGAPLSH